MRNGLFEFSHNQITAAKQQKTKKRFSVRSKKKKKEKKNDSLFLDEENKNNANDYASYHVLRKHLKQMSICILPCGSESSLDEIGMERNANFPICYRIVKAL
jgi:hypothetical protein